MPTIVSNTLIITTPQGDYCITKAYLSNNSSNNILNLSYSLGPFINGFCNAAISMYNGKTTTIDYITLAGYPPSNRVYTNPPTYYYLLI